MILRNHGLLALGETVREAFEVMYYLDTACQIQIDAMAGGMDNVLRMSEQAARVITSYSIHYTKLYDVRSSAPAATGGSQKSRSVAVTDSAPVEHAQQRRPVLVLARPVGSYNFV